ncbi:hypothetical protein SEUCBS139899_001679 [Sporothrix eucalyptigena]
MPSRPSTSSGTAPSRPPPPSAFSTSLAPPSGSANFNRRISRDDMFLGSQLKTSTAAFDKRISRDDLYLGTRPPAARSGVFHIPLRTQPATVEEGSVDLGIVPPPAAWPVRRATPESLMSGEIQIGMALGSPVHASPPEQPVSFRQPQRSQTDRMQRAEPATYASWQPKESAQTHDSSEQAPLTTSEAPVQRSKTTRRKLFGIFGSKRHQDPVKSTLTSNSSAYSLEASDSSSVVMSAAVPAASSSSAERPTTRSGKSKHQPIIVQIVPEPATATNIKASNGSPAPSVFAPSQTPVPGPAPSIKEGRRPFLRSKASEPAIRKKLEISNPMPLGLGNNTMTNLNSMNAGNVDLSVPAMPGNSHLMPPPVLGASPYLDVEIPEARMERYSVMFGSLLGSGPSWQPASSLLARRQATLDKLKTINDRMHQEDLERNYVAAAAADAMVTINGLPSPGLQRRATSPHVTRSPAFSLFPGRSPSVNHINAPLPSPRLRSNTSPAATRSPMRPGFDFLQPPGMAAAQQQQQQQQQRYNNNPLRANPPSVVNRKPPTTSKAMPVSITATAPAPASAKMNYFDPMQSNLILDSPTEMDYPAEQLQQPFKPVIQEPQWQMISPPSSTGSTSSSSRGGGSSKASGSSSNGSPASTASLEFDVEESDKELKSAVEISIARQISISRQQRQLLRPLKTNNLAPPSSLAAIPSGNTPISSTSSPSRSATLKLGRNERLQETKTSTPTLVVAPSSILTDDRNDRSDRPAPLSLGEQQQRQQEQQQRMRYLSPRSNANANSNLQAYQMAQNRKSERVILEAA